MFAGGGMGSDARGNKEHLINGVITEEMKEPAQSQNTYEYFDNPVQGSRTNSSFDKYEFHYSQPHLGSWWWQY